MNTTRLLATCYVLLLGFAQVANAAVAPIQFQPQRSGQSTNIVHAALPPATISARGANYRIWQRAVPVMTNDQGRIIYRTNSYTELATGMHHLVGGKWVESTENIQITSGGGLATNGAHQVGFTANINTSNAVEIVTPDGKSLRTHIMGISYFDANTGSNVLIAQLKDSIGQLAVSNRVIYSNAFTDFRADVRYTYRRSGFEQDIVLREQPPKPANYGLAAESTELQVWTEFFEPPLPGILPDRDGSDITLDFGSLKMDHGRAFLLGSETNAVPVRKQWVTQAGRTFLVESVRFSSIQSKLESLPSSNLGQGGASILSPRRYQNLAKEIPPVPERTKDGQELKMAVQPDSDPGLALDYQTVNTDQTNMVFQGDTTYYITGNLYLWNTTTIEAGTVIKFADNSSGPGLVAMGDIVCPRGQYQTAILTSDQDNSVGAVIDGSSGTPTTGSWDTYLSDNSGLDLTLRNLRFNYAYQGFWFGGADTEIWDCQFVNCYSAVVLNGGLTDNCNFHNVLMVGGWTAILNNGYLVNASFEHVTADCQNFTVAGTWIYSEGLTNCILNGFDPGDQSGYNYSAQNICTNPGGSAFQSAGAGNYYLADGSALRGAGTSNISSGMRLELLQRTTYPPVLPASFYVDDIPLNTTNNVEGPTALRDTNATPDLGYHYDPIDYMTTPCYSNAVVTLTNGVVIGYWRNLAFLMDNGSGVVSQGSPTQRNVITYYSFVQEQPIVLSGYSGYPTYVDIFDTWHSDPARDPVITLKYTDIHVPLGAMNLCPLYPNYQLGGFSVKNCEFYGAGSQFQMFFDSGTVFDFENNLFQYTQFYAYGYGQFSGYNNLFRGTSGYWYQVHNSGSAVITNRDNVFDGTSFSSDGTSGYNAFLNGAYDSGTFLAGDIVTNLSWVAGPLGNFYQPVANPLLNAGSRSAGAAGLYHYTVLTNEAVDGNALVTMGYHYIGLGSNGLPLDSNGDGIPDYIQDPNGNGLVDYGETDWRTPAPSTISGLILWLRGDPATVVTNGSGNVSKWIDQSGNTNDAGQQSPNSAQQPVWVANQANGWPVLRFSNPANDYLQLTNFPASSLTQVEAFVLVKASPYTNVGEASLWRIGLSAIGYNQTAYPTPSGGINDGFGSYSAYGLGNQIQRLDQFHLYNPISAPNYWAARINGNLQYENGGAPGAGGNSVVFENPPAIGNAFHFDGGGAFDGEIAEILIFNRQLTAAERDQIGVYLNDKYALITSIPPSPTNLVATAISTNQISLTWSTSLTYTNALTNDVTAFKVERMTGSGGSFTQVAEIYNGLSYVDTNLAPATQYYYRVKAVNYAGDSLYSNTNASTTPSSGVTLPLAAAKLWLKADTGVVMDTNGAVCEWLDLSGGGYDGFQSYTAQQPSWVTNQVNGLPALNFSGSTSVAFANFLSSLTAGEGYVILKAASTNPTYSSGLWHFASDNNGTLGYPNVSGDIIDDFGSTSAHDAPPVQPVTQFNLYNVSSQSNGWFSWLNGISQFSTTNNTVGFSDVSGGCAIGASGGFSDNHFTGEIAEVLVFGRTLSFDERITVGQYLVSKYGISLFGTTNSTPGAPTNLIANGPTPYRLNLHWSRTSTNETSIILERKIGSSGTYQEVASVFSSVTNFVDTNVTYSNLYYYRAKSANYFGQSGYSMETSPPIVGLTLTSTNAYVTVGSTNNLIIQASDADSTISQVSLVNGINPLLTIATATTVPYTNLWIPTNQEPFSFFATGIDVVGNSWLTPLLPVTVYLDSNGDGIPDVFQVQSGNDPLNPWTPPTGVTNTTPPNINLVVPANTTLLP